MTKYLMHTAIAGPGNQYSALKESLILAYALDRSLVLPVFLPHESIRDRSAKHFEFGDIFDRKSFESKAKTLFGVKCVTFSDVRDLANAPGRHTAICVRNDQYESQSYFYLEMYNRAFGSRFGTEHFEVRKLQGTTPLSSFGEIDNFYANNLTAFGEEPELLVLIGVYSTLDIGGVNSGSAQTHCAKIYCLNCRPNPHFQVVYEKACRSLDFCDRVKVIGDEFIRQTFGHSDYLAFHLRICDYPDGHCFDRCYSGYSEQQVLDALARIRVQYEIEHSKIFLAAPPQLFTAVAGVQQLTELHRLDPKGMDPHMVSTVEQYICSRATVFVRSYTNQPDEPRQAHTRSSWAELVEGIRRSMSQHSTVTIDDFIQ